MKGKPWFSIGKEKQRKERASVKINCCFQAVRIRQQREAFDFVLFVVVFFLFLFSFL